MHLSDELTCNGCVQWQGTEDRGYVLKSTDEVTVLLEDMGLNLQSMMASPFVRPFLEDVRKWEQRLSLIGECTEVRFSHAGL
jgi:dynein heavy chain, axonemal